MGVSVARRARAVGGGWPGQMTPAITPRMHVRAAFGLTRGRSSHGAGCGAAGR